MPSSPRQYRTGSKSSKVQEKLKQGPNYSQGLNVGHLVEVPDLDRPVVGAAVQRVRFLPEHETGNWIAVAPEGVDALEVVAGAWTDLPDVNESTVVASSLQCGRDFWVSIWFRATKVNYSKLTWLKLITSSIFLACSLLTLAEGQKAFFHAL